MAKITCLEGEQFPLTGATVDVTGQVKYKYFNRL